MAEIIHMRPRKLEADVRYTKIWSGEQGEKGEHIVLAHGKWLNSGREEYAILYMPSEEAGGFEIVQHFPIGEHFLNLARFAAEIADRTLYAFIFTQDDGEGA